MIEVGKNDEYVEAKQRSWNKYNDGVSELWEKHMASEPQEIDAYLSKKRELYEVYQKEVSDIIKSLTTAIK